jgi:hypothetical protein
VEMLLIPLAILDGFFFGYCYENKQWFKTWLFKEFQFKGITIVPFYRLLQGTLDIIAIYLTYDWFGLWNTLAMLVAWYLMFKEYAYYIFMNQLRYLEIFEEENLNVYWLKRFYFSGWFLFKDKFTVKKFQLSFILSVIILIIGWLVNS